IPALLDRELGQAELVVQEPKLEVLPCIVSDRVYLVEELPEALRPEPVEGLDLGGDQVLELDQVWDPAIGEARRSLHLRDHQRGSLLGAKGRAEGRDEVSGPGSTNRYHTNFLVTMCRLTARSLARRPPDRNYLNAPSFRFVSCAPGSTWTPSP